jgi:hypothetical protein
VGQTEGLLVNAANECQLAIKRSINDAFENSKACPLGGRVDVLRLGLGTGLDSKSGSYGS